MFHNNRIQSYSHNEKITKPRTKKYKSHKKSDISKQLKSAKNSKFEKNRKHSKFKRINTVSDYLGPNRLTKHVGFLSKGKISDSISRIENVMSKEVKARAKQDLQEILKLSHSGKYKYKKNGSACFENVSFEAQSFQSNYKSPQYLNHKSIFASSSWKDKLQKSVGVTNVNSVLASVHEPQKTSPVKDFQLIARKVLLNKVHPFIKQTNDILFSDRSSVNKLQNKLCVIKNKFLTSTTIPFEKASSSVVYENSQVYPNNQETNHTQSSVGYENSQVYPKNQETNYTQSSVEEDFHLNPIFTGDVIDQTDFTKIFPSINELTDKTDNSVINNNTNKLTNDLYLSETISILAQSSNDEKSSVTLVPISPLTSEEDSPVWKLQLSPAKFMPELPSTPYFYFRHKMF